MAFDLGATVPLEAGQYQGSVNYRGGDPQWDLRYIFREVNPSGPVCVLVPGYRSRGLSSVDNARLSRAITENLGVSVLAYDYSGSDNRFFSDPATIESYVEDTQFLTDSLGPRAHLLISKSYGVNIAFAAASQDTMGVIASFPAPDLFQKTIGNYMSRKPKHRFVFEAGLSTVGVFWWKPSSNKSENTYTKLSRKFWQSTQSNALSDVFERRSDVPRMPVTIIGNDGDSLGNPQVVRELQEMLAARGHEVESQIVQGDRHAYSDHTHTAVLGAVERHIGLG